MATIDNSSSEDKKKKYMLSDEEIATLAALAGKTTHVKVSREYRNLEAQKLDALREVADLKEQIFKLNEELILDSGNFASEALLNSIYGDFVTRLMGGNAFLGNGEEEVTVTRKELYEFASDIYCKVEAARILRKIGDIVDKIYRVEKNIDLARKGVLL